MKRIVALVLSLLMLANLAGCGGNQTASSQGSNSGTATKDTLNIGIGSEFSNLVPMCNNVVVGNRDGIDLFAMYDPLLWFDTTTSTIKPWVATKWSVSANGLEYTLTLRNDVTFHDGTKMTAEDVAWTLNLIPKNPAVGMQNFPHFNRAEVVNDTTVKIILDKPFAAMLNALASYHLVVLSKAYFDKVGWDGYLKHPIGTGPYKFMNRVLGGSLTLEANNAYWNGAPKIKNVVFKILPDANAQLLSLETGEIDVLQNSSIQNMKKVEKEQGITWDSCSSFLNNFVYWGSNSAMATDENLRKAVASAINVDVINKTLNLGYTKSNACILSPGITGRPDNSEFTAPLSYNLEAAKQYLAKSSYTPGTALKLICLSGSKEENISKIIQGDLQAIGVTVDLNALDGATYITYQNAGNYDVAIYSTLPSLYDANLLFQYFDPSTVAYKNMKFPDKQELADLGQQSISEMNPSARKAIFAKMLSIINEHTYQIPLYQDVNTIAWRTGLKGIKAIPGTNYRIADWAW